MQNFRSCRFISKNCTVSKMYRINKICKKDAPTDVEEYKLFKKFVYCSDLMPIPAER